MQNLMSIREFQERFSVSRSTVYRLKQRGEFPFVKVGAAVRIRTDDAESWFERLGATHN
jgi:excisionase family DNA binding protein